MPILLSSVTPTLQLLSKQDIIYQFYLIELAQIGSDQFQIPFLATHLFHSGKKCAGALPQPPLFRQSFQMIQGLILLSLTLT